MPADVPAPPSGDWKRRSRIEAFAAEVLTLREGRMPRSQWGFLFRIVGRPGVVPVLAWLLWWLLTVAVQAA